MKPLLIKAGKFGGGGVAPRTESGALVAPGLRPRSVGSIIGHPNEEIKKKGWLLKRGETAGWLAVFLGSRGCYDRHEER